jgi:Zn-dependent protease
MKHLDPMGTLLIILAGFGWARPTPVNPANFHHPRRDDLLVTVAGPVSNLLTAILLGVILKFVPIHGAESLGNTFGELLYRAVYFNLLLCFFNLIPIFPLDGARIVRALLPLRQAYAFSRLEQYGPILLLLVIALGSYSHLNLLGSVIGPPIQFFMGILT